MRILSKLAIFSLLVGMLSIACSKENVDQINAENPNFQPDTVDVNPFLAKMNSFSNDTVYISCVAIPYPFEMQQASGNRLIISDKSDLQAATLNPDSIIDFGYPLLSVINNSVRMINNMGDLGNAIISCDTGTATCADFEAHVLLFYTALNIFTVNKYDYRINYPVDLIINGQTVTLNQDSDYIPAIGGNPSRYPDADLVYPISITQFGQTIVLNSDQDVCDFHESLSEDCAKKPAHIQFFFNEGGGTPFSCAYSINYPVDVNFNGSQLRMQSASDYTALLNGNPNVLSGLSLVYPVSATKFENGQQLTFAADADICQYLDNCY